MRDLSRVRDKIELRLDVRQLFGAVLVVPVVAGFIFFLGYNVGQKMTLQQVACSGADMFEQGQAQLSLSNNREPLKAEGSARQAGVGYPFREEPAVGRMQPMGSTLGSHSNELVYKEESRTDPMVMDRQTPLASKQDKSGLDSGRLGQAANQEECPNLDWAAAEETQPPAAPIALPVRYTVQVSAYQDELEAHRMLDGLRERGYNPYIVESELDGRGTWFRVRVGRFDSREAASKFADKLKSREQMEAFVAPL